MADDRAGPAVEMERDAPHRRQKLAAGGFSAPHRKPGQRLALEERVRGLLPVREENPRQIPRKIRPTTHAKKRIQPRTSIRRKAKMLTPRWTMVHLN